MNAEAQVWARLTPTMASFRLRVYAFVCDYIARMRASPSYGEIANALGTTRERVRKAVLSLVRDGLLLRTPGPRGLMLPRMLEDAIRTLRECGFEVDDQARAVHVPVTKRALLTTAALDYHPERGTEGGEPDRQGARRSQ